MASQESIPPADDAKDDEVLAPATPGAEALGSADEGDPDEGDPDDD